MQSFNEHQAVLKKEVIHALDIKPEGIYIDGTFGRGGHSKLILSQLEEKGTLWAFDRDPEAELSARNISAPNFFFIKNCFSQILHHTEKMSITGKVDGIVLDFGFSSPQIENPNRGFSFMKDGPLDMRMDPESGKPLHKLLGDMKEHQIFTILKKFGEERFSKRIARQIFNYKSKKSITSTQELAKIVVKALPKFKKVSRKRHHPATRTFQAMRIWINNELEEIKKVLRDSINILSLKGRLVVISFHSLEDRIVKKFMLDNSQKMKFPPRLPVTEEYIKNISNPHLSDMRKVFPKEEEIKKNPRSRSAILRVTEKIN